MSAARLVRLAAARLPDAQHVLQHMGHVADDREIDMDHLVDRGRVDVDMRLLANSGEKSDAAGDPVVEAGADIDHQIAAMHGEVGLVEPVHPQHAEPVLARGRIGAQAHQRRGDRKARGLHQLAQQRLASGPELITPPPV
jgi:hypothetical protein